MNKEFWLKHSSRAVVIFLAVKFVMGMQNVIYPKPSIQPVTVTHKLDTLYDESSDTFSVLDRTNVRRQFGEKDGVFILFLLGKTLDTTVQESLQTENMLHGDMVQISVRDHYKALSYKTLTGFIWANR